MNQQDINKASMITALIVKRLKKEPLSVEESVQLETWFKENGENYLFFEEMMDEQQLEKDMLQLLEIDQNKEKVHERVMERISKKDQKHYTLPWWRYMAAAVIVITLLITAFWYSGRTREEGSSTGPFAHDVMPGGKKAVLTLADGSQLSLDALSDSSFTEANAAGIQLKEGVLAYNGLQDNNGNIYNTVHTPVGGEFKVVLADGTKVWLNAGSTLHFPARFEGAQRKVELSGEAFFDVAKNTRPFVVQVGGTSVQVLGTQFNISAYNKDAVKTTLIEGAVRVIKDKQRKVLEPGQTAVSAVKEQTIDIANTSTLEVTAWKEGKFVFEGTPLTDVMDQLARWYGITVHYEGDIPSAHINGEIGRQQPLSKILQMLQLTGAAQFEIQKDKQILVLPPAHVK